MNINKGRKPLKILFVENNPGDVRLIQEMFKEVGNTQIDLAHADCLARGLERLAEKGFDALLLDLGLPDSQGLDTLRRTHAQAPEIPIIVLTGLANEMLGLQAVQAGAQDYLMKGQVDGVLLMKTIHYAIERKKAHEAMQTGVEVARRLAQENAILAEIGRIISSTLDIEEVYDSFAKEALELIPFDRISINLINLEEGTAVVSYVAGLDLPGRRFCDTYLLKDSVTGKIMNNRLSLLIQPETREELAGQFLKFLPHFQAGFRSMIGVPLIYGEAVIGVLYLCSRKLKAYTDRDLRLADAIGAQIAGAIANAQFLLER